MKVIYKKSIIEKMDGAILEVNSRLHGKKEIEKFVLTEEEYNELSSYLLQYCHYVYNTENGKVFPGLCEYRGFKVEKED